MTLPQEKGAADLGHEELHCTPSSSTPRLGRAARSGTDSQSRNEKVDATAVLSLSMPYLFFLLSLQVDATAVASARAETQMFSVHSFMTLLERLLTPGHMDWLEWISLV